MKTFRQLIHSLFTGSPQPNVSKEIAGLQEAYRGLRAEMNVQGQIHAEHAEKTRLLLERYRARSQPRKDGKFGSEEPAVSTNSRPVVEHPTHEQIEQMGRSQGLIK